ncbi:MAG: spore coat protein [Bacilli bacterium]|nr:spore coat protein [Bacilli bacterium]
MNDQLIMDNYLLLLKSTVEVYVHGTLESSNEDVRSNLKDCLNEILTSQANTYNLMTKFGWYNINNVQTSEITKTLNNINSNN